MGSGSGTQVFKVKGNPPSFPMPENRNLPARNLMKSQLGGVIFGCKHTTIKECLSKQLLGLPQPHFSYVKNIHPGLPLFLFNYSDRKLHGIFEAAGSGQLNIDPYGWTSNGSERTPYPAQVQICVRRHCQPLTEEQFRPAIADNYYNPHHFWFELDHDQTNKLICLLASFAVAPRPPVSDHTRNPGTIFRALPSSVTKQDTEGFKLPALRVDQFADGTPSVDEVKKEFGNLHVSENENLKHSSRKSDSTDGASCFSRDDHLFEAYSDAQVVEHNDKDLMLKKLKDLTLKKEQKDASLTENTDDANFINDRCTEERHAPGEQMCSEDKNKENSCAPTHFQDIMAQLMDEMKELKAFRAEQTTKICYLEHKLVEAQSEIQRLKDRCTILESLSNPSNVHADEMVMESMEDSQLNATDSIFLLGGYDGELWSSALHRYFPGQDVIKAYRPMSSVRSYASVSLLDGKIYVFGGGDDNGWYNTAESYNPSDDLWTCCPSLNGKKGSLGGATLNEKIFAIGGGNGVESFSDVEMLDLDIGRWIQTRSMLQKRFAVAAVELNGAIYAVGGYDGNKYLNTAEKFDPREQSWTRIATMNARRGCHTLVVLNEKLYAIGGFDGDSMVSSVEVYDPRLGTWMAGDPMKHPRGYSAAAVANSSIYVIGGLKNAESEISDNVECFKESKGWQDVAGTSIGKRCFLSAIAL